MIYITIKERKNHYNVFNFQVKTEGFDLLSKESIYMKDKQSAAEGDAWVSVGLSN